MTSSFESTKFRLDEATKDAPLDTIASRVVDTIAHDNKLGREMKKELFSVVHAWRNYVKEQDVKTDDLFAIRWHIDQFAQQHFPAPEHEDIELLSAPVDSLVLPNGQPYTKLVQKAAGSDVINSPGMAFFGGAARIALKLLAAERAGMTEDERHVLINPELPVSDVDIIINRSAVRSSGQFNADLAGTRIVGDIKEDMKKVLANIDCSFNQVMVWQGVLYYTAQGLEDAREGIVRLTDREDALFGSDTSILEDGKQYIRQKGFYRGFSFLLRNKARAFPIYKENLEREARNIGRYWIVLLSQKILPIKDEGRQRRAISDWFNLAKKLGVTKRRTAPVGFLIDLLAQFPEGAELLFKKYKTPEEKFENQVSWLARKLIKRALTTVMKPESKQSIHGMSDEQVIIDRDFYRGPRHDPSKLLQFIRQQRSSYNNPNTRHDHA